MNRRSPLAARPSLPAFLECLTMLRKLILALALWSCSVGVLAGPVPWTDAPYSYYARDVSLTQALIEFAAGFSLSLQVSPGIGAKVNGRFNNRNPGEFLDQLCSTYGLVWFTHGGTLYISKAAENVTRSLPASAGNLGGLRQALTDLGVLEPRFGWGELADQGVVLVSGPPNYVRLIEDTLNKLPQIAGGQQTAIFRLKYASVADRTISFRGQSHVTPGLASIVRNLMGAAGPQGITSDAGLATGLGTGSGLSDLAPSMRVLPPLVNPEAGGAPAHGAASGAGGSVTGSSAGRRVASVRNPRVASVQADTRINALIVQDSPERIPIWASLISQLDVPTALIEIEAMIIDVNSQQLEELGISWGGRFGRVAGGFGNPGAADNATISLNAGSGVTPSTLVVDTGNFLISRIRALEGMGEARIQSRPSILTVDNVSAVIDLSETFYVRTTGERVATVTPITTGTTLRVTPHFIESDGERLVQLAVDIEDGKIQDRQIDQLPTVSRSIVSTQAIVTEDQTLLIGGYNTDQDLQRKDAVPFLGRLPGVGGLFSSRSKDVQKRERLFLIKPKLISVPSDMVSNQGQPDSGGQ